MKINFSQIGMVILAAVLLSLLYNYLSPKGVNLFSYDHKKLLSAELLGDNVTEPKHISLDEAKKLFDADVLFIDAREHEDYLQGHIKNSINVPFDDYKNYEDKVRKIPKDEPVVLYCNGSDCDLSILLGNKLSSMGYTKVFVFFGGWNLWEEAHYPVEKSK